MIKGSITKTNILEVGLKQVRQFGYEALSIGELAKSVGMSKSGLFAHCKSKELLQVMILNFAAENFVLRVIRPALQLNRGLPRLQGIIDNWVNWSHLQKNGGCPLVSAAVEFDDRPGKVRDVTKAHLKDLQDSLAKSIELTKMEGHFREDTDSNQLAFEIFSNILGLHLYERLLDDEKALLKFKDSISALLNQHKI